MYGCMRTKIQLASGVMPPSALLFGNSLPLGNPHAVCLLGLGQTFLRWFGLYTRVALVRQLVRGPARLGPHVPMAFHHFHHLLRDADGLLGYSTAAIARFRYHPAAHAVRNVDTDSYEKTMTGPCVHARQAGLAGWRAQNRLPRPSVTQRNTAFVSDEGTARTILPHLGATTGSVDVEGDASYGWIGASICPYLTRRCTAVRPHCFARLSNCTSASIKHTLPFLYPRKALRILNLSGEWIP
jgi:hypothetical protein